MQQCVNKKAVLRYQNSVNKLASLKKALKGMQRKDRAYDEKPMIFDNLENKIIFQNQFRKTMQFAV